MKPRRWAQFFSASKNLLENKCVHFKHGKKRKARQNKHSDVPSLKAGRQFGEYSIEDAVKMVSLIKLQTFKVNIAERVCSALVSSFLTDYFSLYKNFVLLKFSKVTHNKLQLDQAIQACSLQDIVSTQTIHYHHVHLAKKYAPSNVSHEGLVVDVVFQ